MEPVTQIEKIIGCVLWEIESSEFGDSETKVETTIQGRYFPAGRSFRFSLKPERGKRDFNLDLLLSE